MMDGGRRTDREEASSDEVEQAQSSRASASSAATEARQRAGNVAINGVLEDPHVRHWRLMIAASRDSHAMLASIRNESPIVGAVSDRVDGMKESAVHFFEWVKGSGDEHHYIDAKVALPDLDIWDEPTELLNLAALYLEDEPAKAPAAFDAVQAAYNRCAQRVNEYRERTISGANATAFAPRHGRHRGRRRFGGHGRPRDGRGGRGRRGGGGRGRVFRGAKPGDTDRRAARRSARHL